MSDSGWIDHDGGPRPEGNFVALRCRDESQRHPFPLWQWRDQRYLKGCDVVAYKPYRATPEPVADAAPAPDHSAKAEPLTRAGVLDVAKRAVTQDRAATHGALENSFAAIAAIWSVRLGVTVTPAQVAIMMVDLKTVRAWGNPGHGDNWVDIAGYAACGGELSGAPHDPE